MALKVQRVWGTQERTWIRGLLFLLVALPLTGSPAPYGTTAAPEDIPVGSMRWWGDRSILGPGILRIPERTPSVAEALKLKGDMQQPIVFSPGVHMLGKEVCAWWRTKTEFIAEHGPLDEAEGLLGDSAAETEGGGPPPPGLSASGAVGVADGACHAPDKCGAPFPAGDKRRVEVWGNWTLHATSEGVFAGLAMAVHSATCDEAVLSIIGGPWHFMQGDVRSIGGLGIDTWAEAEVVLSLCAVGGIDSHLQRCDVGVRGKMESRCVLDRTVVEFCGAIEGYGVRLSEKAEATLRGCTVRDCAIGVCLERDVSAVFANSTLYRCHLAPLYCGVSARRVFCRIAQCTVWAESCQAWLNERRPLHLELSRNKVLPLPARAGCVAQRRSLRCSAARGQVFLLSPREQRLAEYRGTLGDWNQHPKAHVNLAGRTLRPSRSASPLARPCAACASADRGERLNKTARGVRCAAGPTRRASARRASARTTCCSSRSWRRARACRGSRRRSCRSRCSSSRALPCTFPRASSAPRSSERRQARARARRARGMGTGGGGAMGLSGATSSSRVTGNPTAPASGTTWTRLSRARPSTTGLFPRRLRACSSLLLPVCAPHTPRLWQGAAILCRLLHFRTARAAGICAPWSPSPAGPHALCVAPPTTDGGNPRGSAPTCATPGGTTIRRCSPPHDAGAPPPAAAALMGCCAGRSRRRRGREPSLRRQRQGRGCPGTRGGRGWTRRR